MNMINKISLLFTVTASVSGGFRPKADIQYVNAG